MDRGTNSSESEKDGGSMKPKSVTAKAEQTVRLLKPLDTCCMRCEYDEAEGLLVNHCNACTRKIVTALWRVRENARHRARKEKRNG